MYRIRFHGRGGQGIKTASRMLGTALFESGLEVQDAPKYGAERRGAPMFAFVRADRQVIKERGPVVAPDLLLVADETLFLVPAAGVLSGLMPTTVLVIASNESADEWRARLKVDNPIYNLPGGELSDENEIPDVSALLAGAAARLTGLVAKPALLAAVDTETAKLGAKALAANLQAAEAGFEAMEDGAGAVRETTELSAAEYETPGWIDLQLDPAAIAAPNVYATANSVEVRTGLWRSLRPVLDPDRCGKCVWICGTACPDGVININNAGYPEVDYDHCKGCMICVVQCPRHAYDAIPEQEADETVAAKGAPS